MNFPHILRSISRIAIVLFIVAGFGMAIAGVGRKEEKVKGASEVKNEIYAEEINKTIKVIEERPDYAGAWVRLSVLYNQVGETMLSEKALENAKRLNPDL